MSTTQSKDFLVPGILDIPPELLLNIFRFIEVRQLFYNVVRACKTFHEILTSEGIWKTLFALKWKENNIVEDLTFISSWSNMYISYEDIENYWKSRKSKLISKLLTGHYGIVDSVYILPSKDIYVSGGRDRDLFVWRISESVENNFETSLPIPDVLKGHKGWIWSIESDKCKENEVVTISWDKTVKTWDLNHAESINNYKYHPAAVLAICCDNGIYTTGCYDKAVRRFDVRSGDVVQSYVHHKRPVVTLQMNGNYIFSGSEDQSVGIFDIRADKLLTKLRVDTPVLCMNLALDQGLNYLRVGGKDGNLYLFDISDGRFSLLNSYQLWSDGNKVTKLCNYRGCLLACSQNGSVNAFTPDRQCSFIKKMENVHAGGVTSCYARGDALLTGGSDASVVAWKFKPET